MRIGEVALLSLNLNELANLESVMFGFITTGSFSTSEKIRTGMKENLCFNRSDYYFKRSTLELNYLNSNVDPASYMPYNLHVIN